MKAISVRQPWATLIVKGIKDVENRTWRTRHRGPLVIHAAANRDDGAPAELWEVVGEPPRSALVGVVELVDVVDDAESEWAEPGRFHWVLCDAVEFEKPIPWTGAQSLWEVPAGALPCGFEGEERGPR